MKILIVTHYWRPHRGGIEKVAWEQARRLKSRGHEVSVITSRLKGAAAEYVDEDGIHLYRVGCFNLLERWGVPYPMFSPRLFTRMSKLVKSHDVILAHSHSFETSIAAGLMARRHKKPMAMLQHNPYIEYNFPWNVAENALDFTSARLTINSASKVLAISNHTRQYVERIAKSAIVEVLYDGVDVPAFAPVTSDEERREIRRRLGLPEDRIIFFTLRRLVFRNGLDLLLNACISVKYRDDIAVVIGGSGPERPAMEQMIEREGMSNVSLAGFIPDDLLADYYRAADAFVLPTRTGEGFGLVLLEAFASGIPAISTRSGAQDEVVDAGKDGMLVSWEDPGALAGAMIYFANNPELLREMGASARVKAESMDWERNVDRLEEVLAEAAGVRMPGANSPEVRRA